MRTSRKATRIPAHRTPRACLTVSWFALIHWPASLQAAVTHQWMALRPYTPVASTLSTSIDQRYHYVIVADSTANASFHAVRIHDTTLSPAEILLQTLRGPDGDGPNGVDGLTHRYSFSENGGNTFWYPSTNGSVTLTAPVGPDTNRYFRARLPAP